LFDWKIRGTKDRLCAGQLVSRTRTQNESTYSEHDSSVSVQNPQKNGLCDCLPMLVGFRRGEARGGQLERDLDRIVSTCACNILETGLPRTGAPQIAAMIFGFAVGMHALTSGEYSTVAGSAGKSRADGLRRDLRNS
jgi:hypothetical protein